MKKKILILGILAIVGAIIMFVSDYIMLAHPISGKQFYQSGFMYILNIESWRLFLGGVVGVFFLPLGLLGYWQMYIGLKKAGSGLANLFMVFGVYTAIIGALLHILYPVYGEVIRSVSIMNPYTNKYILLLLNTIGEYHKLFFIATHIFQTILGLIFAYIVLFYQTDYPKWMAVSAPGFFSFIFMSIGFFMPAPVGGLISATFVHIGYFFTFLLSTLVLYKKYRNN